MQQTTTTDTALAMDSSGQQARDVLAEILRHGAQRTNPVHIHGSTCCQSTSRDNPVSKQRLSHLFKNISSANVTESRFLLVFSGSALGAVGDFADFEAARDFSPMEANAGGWMNSSGKRFRLRSPQALSPT